MKDSAVYAIGFFAVVALLALIGQSGGNNQLPSTVALALVGVDIALNVAVWRFLPPKRITSLALSAARFLAAIVLFAAAVAAVMASGILIGYIRIQGSSIFGGDNGFALFGTLLGSVLCSGISAVIYLIGQLVQQFRTSKQAAPPTV